MTGKELVLNRDCVVTLIPAGEQVTLEKGSKVYVTQALGGTVTVRNEMGLYRIHSNDLNALGDEAESAVKETEEKLDYSTEFSEEQVWDCLKTCYDPEIPINIVDLGLIYDMRTEDTPENKRNVFVKMTLTAQGCGMGPSIAADAKQKIETIPTINSATVDIVWDPVWNPQMISEDGRKVLGL